MQHKRRWFAGLLGFCAAQAMLVTGLSMAIGLLVFDVSPAIGWALIAGGFMLAMFAVIDPLVPEATPFFTGAIKLAVLGVLLLSTALTVYSVITGQNQLPWLS